MLFRTKVERDKYLKMAKGQEKSLGRVIRELLQVEYARINSKQEAA